MPPFIPKRRLNETPPPSSTPPAKRARLTELIEAKPATRSGRTPTAHIPVVSSDDSDSSLSDVDSDEFENVPSALKDNEQEDDSDDDVNWEDAEAPTQPLAHAPLPTENISITIDKEDNYIDYGASSRTAKKGPSKREKAVRVQTHQMHVQFLLYHNLLRNSWTCDKEVQNTLVKQLPSQIRKEVDKWKRASGLIPLDGPSNTPKSTKKGRKGKAVDDREARDWGRPSSRLEPRAADMSRGDPLISLLKVLSAYWKKRFAITAPGLRKRGYGTKLELRRELESYRSGPHDQELHGELLPSLEHFRTLAKKCEGSRDVGAQLFTALLRGLGIESRLIASLQPAGYGWTKAEQMALRKQAAAVSGKTPVNSSDAEARNSVSKAQAARGKPPVSSGGQKMSVGKGKGQKDMPIELDSDVDDASGSEEDSESVIDVTPSIPKARRPLYDRELAFPIYWTEAISPITSKPIPCSPLVLENPVATTDEYLTAFEPRGAKAEASKLVMAYVVGYSSDNTAKDLTVRYLRKRIFPGKARPFRFPIQSVPVYSSSGKVKRYEDYDWFKTVLSPYTRPDKLRKAIDDIEDTTDLIPQEPEKKNEEDGIDTLTSLKGSPDFVLERHLRREEAVRPGVKPDRMFVSGKEPNLKSEPVYRRSDIERCLTAESWHKEGRRPINGEVAMKLVPVRAVTLTRKREAEEHQRITGEKQLQGLYSWDQTEYIIPPPIVNGVIPKNSYGNIDAFVPTMVPRGAVHVPLKSTVRLCKRLEIDYAEAVVGFEFGNKRAVPVIRGVVVAKENEKMLRDAWKEYDEAQRKKEETKMERLVLDLWRKFVMGLRIRKEVGEVYGGRAEAGGTNSMRANKGESKDAAIDVDEDEDMAGGFEPETTDQAAEEDFRGGFLLPDEDDQLEHEDLVMEDPPGTQENIHAATEAAMEESAAEEREEAPHIPVRLRKGKEKELQYPTPVSMPTVRPKALVERTKRTRLHQANDSDNTDEKSESELSSIPESPTTETPPLRSISNTPSSSEPDPDSDSEPDYLPPSKTKTRTTPISNKRRRHQKHPLSTHPTDAPANPPSAGGRSVTRNHNRTALAPIVKTATPSKRGRGRLKNVITSPYFDDGSRSGSE